MQAITTVRLETTSKQSDSAVINACFLHQTEFSAPGAVKHIVMISKPAFKWTFFAPNSLLTLEQDA